MQLRTGLTEAIILEVDGGLHVWQAWLALQILSMLGTIVESLSTVIMGLVWLLLIGIPLIVSHRLKSHMMVVNLAHRVRIIVHYYSLERLLGRRVT